MSKWGRKPSKRHGWKLHEKSLVGRDWLTQLNFRVAEGKFEDEYDYSVNNIVNKVELSPELKKMKKRFPKFFKRQGKFLGHIIKIEFKEGAKITQKRKKSPLQLQKSVDVEIKNLLEA